MIDINNRSAWFYPLLITASFILSRLLFYAMGIRFDVSGLDWYWQYLDIELLKTDLLNSVFHQHAQPPLYNLFLGMVLKLFPKSYPAAFALLYKAFSLTLYFILYRVLCLLRFKPWIAYLAATLFILSPAVVLYENWLFYTWPVAVLLTFAAHQILLYKKTGRTEHALLYIAAITVVCLLRSMFHLVYLVAALLPVIMPTAPNRRRIGFAAGAAILLVATVFLKNLLLFGFFGSSSWMGMNLWKIAPTGGKAALLADSAVVHQEPFSSIIDYPETYRPVPDSFTAIPAVAAEFKHNGTPNLNHYGYIAVSEAYKSKALELIRKDPAGYMGLVLKAWGIYVSPASGYHLLDQDNSDSLRMYARMTAPADPRLLVPAALILVALFLKAVVRSHVPLNIEARVFFTFCAGTVFYTAILGNCMEHGENMRFRMQTDPLLFLAALLAVPHLYRILLKLPNHKAKENRKKV